MDNGVRADHEVFEGIEVESVDMLESTDDRSKRDGTEMEAYGDHGTLLAGLIVERAPKVRLISLRSLNSNGRGSWSNLLKGLHWITNHHPKGQPAVAVLNLGGIPKPEISDLVVKSIDQMVDDGVIAVVAAGNEGGDSESRIPSKVDSVISVGAVSFFNYRMGDSNFGSSVDIYAAGENKKGPSSKSRNARTRKSGTSIAAAVVAGHVTAYLAKRPTATPFEVKEWVLGMSERGKVKNFSGPNKQELIESSLLFQLK